MPSLEDLKVILPETEADLMDKISAQLILSFNEYIALAIFTVIVERSNKLDMKPAEALEPLRILESKRWQDESWRPLNELIAHGNRVEDCLKKLASKLWNVIEMQ